MRETFLFITHLNWSWCLFFNFVEYVLLLLNEVIERLRLLSIIQYNVLGK